MKLELQTLRTVRTLESQLEDERKEFRR